jgi:hypothetical protein
MGFFLGYSSNS